MLGTLNRLDPPDASSLSRIRNANERYMAEYARSDSVRLLGAPERITADRTRLILGYAQPWTDAYRRMLMARFLLETDPSLRRMSRIHVMEENSHCLDLGGSRGGAVALWDPVIAACGAWIVDAMATLSQVGRLALVQFALEGSTFVATASGLRTCGSSRYSRLNEERVAMGFEELSRRQDWGEDEILSTISRGWDIVSTFTDRCAQLVFATEFAR